MILDSINPHETIVVAMSGGVDSSVTAALLHDHGYHVIGVTLQLYDHGAAVEKKGACCAGVDIQDARQVAHDLGIKHYVLDYETLFKERVVDDFVASYLEGETPLPCVRCNQKVKFHDLLTMAQRLNAKGLATGHYIQREWDADKKKVLLKRGHDLQKDQSYFLFTTTQKQADYLYFPLGGQTKEQTRALAMKYGLKNAKKPDSQDICFVPDGNYANLVKKIHPQANKKGNIIDKNGRVLSKHDGIIHYTIGQRKGLGIGGRKDDTEPLYVIAIKPKTNEVVVGKKEDLSIEAITLHEMNWLGECAWSEVKNFSCLVQFRSQMAPIKAFISSIKTDNNEEKKAMVVFEEKQYGVSPGQALVCYEHERLLGGGFIDKRDSF